VHSQSEPGGSTSPWFRLMVKNKWLAFLEGALFYKNNEKIKYIFMILYTVIPYT